VHEATQERKAVRFQSLRVPSLASSGTALRARTRLGDRHLNSKSPQSIDFGNTRPIDFCRWSSRTIQGEPDAPGLKFSRNAFEVASAKANTSRT
jgi:hypothetical protein